MAFLLIFTAVGCSADKNASGGSVTSAEIAAAPGDDTQSVFDMDAIYRAFGAYDREFPDERNMVMNPGIISQDDVTGPFLLLCGENGKTIVPDTEFDSKAGTTELPLGYRLLPDDDEGLTEYRDLIENADKLNAVSGGEKETVFVVMECVGYNMIGEYQPKLELHEYMYRVGFYNLDGELVAWHIAYWHLSAPMSITSSDYYGDENGRFIYKGEGESASAPWSDALEDLFWTEDGFLIVGTEVRGCSLEADVIVIPDGITSVGYMALRKNGMREVILPEGLLSVGYAAFSGCENLVSVNIPDSVTFIDSYAFSDTPWLDAFEDEFIVVADGLLIAYTGDDTKIVVPDGVKTICPLALEKPEATEVYIPEGVTALLTSDAYGAAINAFYALVRIELPDSLTRLDEGCIDCNNANVTVVCGKGSAADTYALANGMTVEYRQDFRSMNKRRYRAVCHTEGGPYETGQDNLRLGRRRDHGHDSKPLGLLGRF